MPDRALRGKPAGDAVTRNPMSLSDARSIAGTLGFPSKMPGTAYALPASKCIVGSKLVNVPDSVCFGCGDLQGIWHLAKICEVAAATPNIRHWIATRETKMVLDFVASGGIIPTNLTVRISAVMMDGPAPKSWPLTSTVHDKAAPTGHACPAPSQNHECGSCRACWSKDVPNVSYAKH